jgi:hypothetical protein
MSCENAIEPQSRKMTAASNAQENLDILIAHLRGLATDRPSQCEGESPFPVGSMIALWRKAIDVFERDK